MMYGEGEGVKGTLMLKECLPSVLHLNTADQHYQVQSFKGDVWGGGGGQGNTHAQGLFAFCSAFKHCRPTLPTVEL